MIQAKHALLEALGAAIAEAAPGALLAAAFESPKQAAHGDLACTAAMPLAKALKKNPREVAALLVVALNRQPAVQRWVQQIEIAGPGFINLRLAPAAKQAVVAEVLAGGAHFGQQPAQPAKVLVEFVSANPTGPLHLGHARQAALGDAICNLFETQGWQVTREFYYNDAGVQIATLAASVQARLHGFKPGDARWPTVAYNGDYIADIAADFIAKKTVAADDRAFTASGNLDDLDGIRQFAEPTCATSKTSTCKPSACASTTTSSNRACMQTAGSMPPCNASSPRARRTKKAARCGCAPPTSVTTKTA